MKPYLIIALQLLVFSAPGSAQENTDTQPVKEVARLTQQAVPYNLEHIRQTFTKTVHGGVQHVVVKSADDQADIKLIQAHLRKLAEQFQKGDFSVTEHIHGENTPGLRQLKMANPNDIKFAYKALENGAQIHYTSEYPQYVTALHEWFEAQAREHGNDLLPDHSQHHASQAE
jgi:hypothetical protein